jgi:hypothetical protein
LVLKLGGCEPGRGMVEASGEDGRGCTVCEPCSDTWVSEGACRGHEGGASPEGSSSDDLGMAFGRFFQGGRGIGVGPDPERLWGWLLGLGEGY